jgi:branched-chain amino acid transport system substrate-binding protein
VAFIFSSLGTACNSAVRSYLNGRRIPHLFVTSGADKWGNYKQFPWTIGWLPSNRTEAQIFAKYLLAAKPDSRVAMLWQNDDFGEDYVLGVKDVLGGRFDQMVIRSVSYEVTDPTIDSQAASLQASGADVLITAATPKFGAQIIRRVYNLGWTPLHFLSRAAISVAAVMQPAGPEKGVGIISATPTKDPTDPTWQDDPA